MKNVRGKTVLLCVGGGIAAYKTAELVRRLVQAGAEVQVAMTGAAREFVTPLVLQTLSRRPVATSLLDAAEDATIGHIRLADEADVVVVAPATADLISRMVAGAADDIVTAALLVAKVPVVVAPAMNTNMLEHPATQRNLAELQSWGHHIVPSDSGELACGYEGAGRLPDTDRLLEAIAKALTPQDLAGVRLLVSAGPTREPLDPVRYLSNRSSGRMGYEVAAAALRRGAEVMLVSGPTSLASPPGSELIPVESAAEMSDAVLGRAGATDAVVMVAAVADYRPAGVADQKIKKSADSLNLSLERTQDILAALSKLADRPLLVGFAAETQNVTGFARKKMERKGLDLMVANDVGAEGCGFEVSTNRATIIDSSGEEEDTGLIGKDELADRILDRLAGLLVGRSRRNQAS